MDACKARQPSWARFPASPSFGPNATACPKPSSYLLGSTFDHRCASSSFFIACSPLSQVGLRACEGVHLSTSESALRVHLQTNRTATRGAVSHGAGGECHASCSTPGGGPRRACQEPHRGGSLQSSPSSGGRSVLLSLSSHEWSHRYGCRGVARASGLSMAWGSRGRTCNSCSACSTSLLGCGSLVAPSPLLLKLEMAFWDSSDSLKFVQRPFWEYCSSSCLQVLFPAIYWKEASCKVTL